MVVDLMCQETSLRDVGRGYSATAQPSSGLAFNVVAKAHNIGVNLTLVSLHKQLVENMKTCPAMSEQPYFTGYPQKG